MGGLTIGSSLLIGAKAALLKLHRAKRAVTLQNKRLGSMTGSKRILVVDDDDAIQALLDVILLRTGFAIDHAFDGDEALKKLRTAQYDVLLLDIMMPRVNGFEVLQELRCLRPDMLKRTVVFTAANDNTLKHFNDGQVFRLIRKPFDIHAVLGALNDCLTAAGGSLESRTTEVAEAPPFGVPRPRGTRSAGPGTTLRRSDQ